MRNLATGLLVAILFSLANLAAGTPVASASAPALALGGYSPRGIPSSGRALLGATSANENQDPMSTEASLGNTLALHRTYWRGDQVEQALARARDDLSAGRLPWLSFKAPPAPGTSIPLSWGQMAAGAGDEWARALAAQLASLGGPVWVAVHHEPENDGGDLHAWTEMQRRLSPIFRAAPNVAFTVILMGWHQFAAPARNPALTMEALWPGKQYVDVTGFDPYNWYGTINSAGQTRTTFTDLREYYTYFSQWSAGVGGAKWAIAETGLSDSAAALDTHWISRAFSDLREAGGVALTYFDRAKDGETSFRLRGTKFDDFARALKQSRRITDGPLTNGTIVGASLGQGFVPSWVRARPKSRVVSLRWAKPAATRPAVVTRYRVVLSRLGPNSGRWGRESLACEVRAPKRSCIERGLKHSSTYRSTVTVRYSDGRLLTGPSTTFRTKK